MNSSTQKREASASKDLHSGVEIVFENLRFNARKSLRLLNGEKNIFVFKNIPTRVDGAKEWRHGQMELDEFSTA